MGAVSVCRDVTDLKGAEQEARRAHQDFRRVIEASRDGVGIHREGRWVYANSALLSALGYAEMSELLAIPLLDLVPEENAVEARDWLWAPIEGKLPPVREFDFLRRDGSRVSMEVCPALLTEFEGDEAVLVVFRDISQRKQLEGQLILSERMASLGTVASGVGHEINNPLSIIVMNLELALQELQTSSLQNFEKSRTNEMLAEALEAAQRINRIVGDLRVLSSREKSSPSALDLEAVLDSAVGVLLNELRFRAVLTKRYSGNLPRVLAVGPRLAQVALNLLLNAMQSIPEGEAELNSIVLATEMEGDSVRFSVSDTGSGIKLEVAREMFTPFFTTKPVGKGTGLGLWAAHRIVTEHGGTLTVDSEGRWRRGYHGQQWDSSSRRNSTELTTMASFVARTAPRAAKDVSMAGLAGTVGMLAEACGTGAVLDVASIPKPDSASMGEWVTCFPGLAMITADRPGAPLAASGPAVSAACGELTDHPGVALRWPDGITTRAVTSTVTGLGEA